MSNCVCGNYGNVYDAPPKKQSSVIGGTIKAGVLGGGLAMGATLASDAFKKNSAVNPNLIVYSTRIGNSITTDKNLVRKLRNILNKGFNKNGVVDNKKIFESIKKAIDVTKGKVNPAKIKEILDTQFKKARAMGDKTDFSIFKKFIDSEYAKLGNISGSIKDKLKESLSGIKDKVKEGGKVVEDKISQFSQSVKNKGFIEKLKEIAKNPSVRRYGKIGMFGAAVVGGTYLIYRGIKALFSNKNN